MVPAVFSLGIFFVFILATVITIASMLQSRGQWTQAFEKVATRYGGFYSSARLSRPPAASFSYKDSDCRVRCRRKKRGSPRLTEVQITWGDRRPKLEIVPKGHPPRIRSLKKSESTEIGNEEFDSQYSIYEGKKSPGVASQLISNGVIWQIKQLSAFMHDGPVRIALDKGVLTIQKGTYIKQPQHLDDFVYFSLELFDQMQLTQSEGIDFQENDLVSAVEDVNCPICSSDIEGQMVICVRCKTPHCLECWQYNSKCGMYACDEKRFFKVG